MAVIMRAISLRRLRASLTFFCLPSSVSRRRLHSFSRASFTFFSSSGTPAFCSCTRSFFFMLFHNDRAFERKLVSGAFQRFAHLLGSGAVGFENDAAGSDREHVMVDAAFAAAHGHFGWAHRNRLVREDADPEAAFALQIVRDSAARRFDLAGIQPGRLERLEAILAEAEVQAAGFHLALAGAA